MTQMNRSPCYDLTRAPTPAPAVYLESAPAPAGNSIVRETRRPDRANVTLTEATQNGKTVTRFKCVIARVDIINRNGRYYPRSAYQAAIDAAQEDLNNGLLWGLMEHADDWYDPMKGNLNDIAGRYDKVSIEGDDVVGEGIIAETAVGRDLKALLDINVAVGISTACTGSHRWIPAREIDPNFPNGDELIQVMQDDLRFVTIDFVSDPSNPAGRARAAERKQRQAPVPAPQEAAMHPKIKALLEKHGVNTVEELKKVALEEYTDLLEAIARENAALAPQPQASASAESGAVSLSDYRALEQTVVELRGQVTALNTENHNARRDAIAITVLEAAHLPPAGKVKHGETEIDLDASFRAELIGVARAAESEDAAKSAVERKIVERRAALGVRENANAGRPRNENRVNIPTGDTSRPMTEAERRNVPDGERKQLESIRSRSGLL